MFKLAHIASALAVVAMMALPMTASAATPKKAQVQAQHHPKVTKKAAKTNTTKSRSKSPAKATHAQHHAKAQPKAKSPKKG